MGEGPEGTAQSKQTRERRAVCIWLDTVSTRAKEDSRNSEAGVVEMGRLCER